MIKKLVNRILRVFTKEYEYVLDKTANDPVYNIYVAKEVKKWYKFIK